MLIVVPLFLLANPFAPSAQDKPIEWVTLGEVAMFGQADPDSRKLPQRKVAIKFPKDVVQLVDPSKPRISLGDWSVELNEWGNFGRLYRGRGGWEEFRALYDEAQARIKAGGATVWKTKAVIFRRTRVVYKRADGVFESQAGLINEPELQFCLETFARFKALVEAFTRGAIEMQLTVSVEEEPISGFYQNQDVWSLGPSEAGYNYLRGRFNRGDFDSILYMFHPANTRSYSFGGTEGRTNNATQAYVILSNGREGGARIGHTEAMLHEWFHQVEDTYSKYGYGGWEFSSLPELHAAVQNGYTTDVAGYSGWFSWLRDLMTYSVRPGMWAKLKNRQEPDWAAVRTQTHRSEGALYKWDDVKDDPWAKLPFLTPEDLAKRIGADSVEIKSTESQVVFVPSGGQVRTQILRDARADDYSLNNELNFPREAMARIGYRDRDLVFVRFDAIDYVTKYLGDHAAGAAPPANVLGYINIGSKMIAVLDTKLGNDTQSELDLLNLGNDKTGVAVLTRANFLRGEPVQVTLAADAPDARFTVSDADGLGIPVENGVLKLPAMENGTRILKATAVLASGERIERPFVVRVMQPVDVSAEPVGTARVSSSAHQVRLTITNGEKARTVSLAARAPNGWSVTGLPENVSFAPGERREFIANVIVPATAPDGKYEIAFDTNIKEVSTFRVSLEKMTAAALVSNSFDTGADGWDMKRGDNSGWTAVSEAGGVQGNALVIRDKGGTHWGRVNAYGGYKNDGQRDPSFMGYAADAYPFLDFSLKTEFEKSLALVVTLSNGKRYTIMLAGPYQEQWGESKELARAKFIPNGQWQRVVYNLNDALNNVAGPGPHYVVDIGFGDPRQFSSNQYYDVDVATHYVDNFKITRDANTGDNTTKDDPDSELKTGADARSANPEDKARAAAALDDKSPPEQVAAIREMLKDKSPLVRANAALAFTRIKDAASVPVLIDALKRERNYGGAYMVRALAFQDAPEGYTALRQMLRENRGDELNVAEAALALGKKGDPAFAQDLTIMLTAQSWQARRDGVRALAMINDDTAQRMMMSFLLEVDPMVRIEVGRAAKADINPVGKRMEWGSVNDLSDVVRAYDYAALTKSKDAVLRSRGYAGLKETNADIRRIIAEELGNDSQEYHVQPLLGLLSDLNPEVRSAALRSLLKMPGKRDFSEMSVLSAEDYEDVLIPLLQAAKEKKIQVPNAMLERLLKHRNADVRRLAKENIGQ